jgi:hypothetical protein
MWLKCFVGKDRVVQGERKATPEDAFDSVKAQLPQWRNMPLSVAWNCFLDTSLHRRVAERRLIQAQTLKAGAVCPTSNLVMTKPQHLNKLPKAMERKRCLRRLLTAWSAGADAVSREAIFIWLAAVKTYLSVFRQICPDLEGNYITREHLYCALLNKSQIATDLGVKATRKGRKHMCFRDREAADWLFVDMRGGIDGKVSLSEFAKWWESKET